MTGALLIAFGIIATVNAAAIGFGLVARSRELHAIVFSNLDSATENGYFAPGEQLHGATPEDIVEDMQVYGSCEDYTVAELVPYVRKWLRKRGWAWESGSPQH